MNAYQDIYLHGHVHAYTGVFGNIQPEIRVDIQRRKHRLPVYMLGVTAADGDVVTWRVLNPRDNSVIVTLSGLAQNNVPVSGFVVGGTYRQPVLSGWCGSTLIECDLESRIAVYRDGNVQYTASRYMENLGVDDIVSQVEGYASGMVFAQELMPHIVTTLDEANLTTAFNTDHVYVTFAPTLYGSTATLTEILYADITNIVVDGRERAITIEDFDVKFNGAERIVYGYMTHQNSNATPTLSDLLTIRDFNADSYVAVLNCTFTVATDEMLAIGWSNGHTIKATVQDCRFSWGDKGLLFDFGGINEGGIYHPSVIRCAFYKIKQRAPMVRNTGLETCEVVNCVYYAFGDASNGGTLINSATGAKLLAVGIVVKPDSVGEPTYDGVTPVVSARAGVTSSSPDNPLRVVDGLGLQSDDTAKTGSWNEFEPENTSWLKDHYLSPPRHPSVSLFEDIMRVGYTEWGM